MGGTATLDHMRKLELSKCLPVYYIIFFTFEPDGTPGMKSVTNMGDDFVSLTSGQEPIPSNIEHRDCSSAHRTLAPIGSAKKEYDKSFAKSKIFSQGVLKAPMSRF